MDTEEIDELGIVREMCRETIICLGGIFAVHEVPDDVIWQIAKSLDQIFQRTLTKVSKEEIPEETVPERKFQPHPAIQQVLGRLEDLD